MRAEILYRAAADTAKDLLFPARCPVCSDAIPFEQRLPRIRRRCSAASKRSAFSSGFLTQETLAGYHRILQQQYAALVCRECLGAFCFIRPPFCFRCGKQLSELSVMPGETPCCSDCRKKERLFTACRCVCTYEEVEQEILTGIKYKGRREDIELLALLAADVLGEWILSVKPELVVPVPVHKKRLEKRGYNQAGLLAEAIGGHLGIPYVPDALCRRKNTSAMKELTAEERLLSLQDAFMPGRAALSGRLSGRRILLVDDIYTTGATMEACTERLLECGAREVYGLCFAAGRDAAKVLYN